MVGPSNSDDCRPHSPIVPAEAWLQPPIGTVVATLRRLSVSKTAYLLTKSPSNTHSVSKSAILLTKSPSKTHSVSKTADLLTNSQGSVLTTPLREVRPFCWTDLTIRHLVMSSVSYWAHSVQLYLDSILIVITKIFLKLFQEVFDRVELLQI